MLQGEPQTFQANTILKNISALSIWILNPCWIIWEDIIFVCFVSPDMITSLLCRREDGGDVMNLVESDDEHIFQDAVPRLPPLTNEPQTTLVQIHRVPSSRLSAHWRLVEFHNKCFSIAIVCLRWPWGPRGFWALPGPAGGDRRASQTFWILGLGCFYF